MKNFIENIDLARAKPIRYVATSGMLKVEESVASDRRLVFSVTFFSFDVVPDTVVPLLAFISNQFKTTTVGSTPSVTRLLAHHGICVAVQAGFKLISRTGRIGHHGICVFTIEIAILLVLDKVSTRSIAVGVTPAVAVFLYPMSSDHQWLFLAVHLVILAVLLDVATAILVFFFEATVVEALVFAILVAFFYFVV